MAGVDRFALIAASFGRTLTIFFLLIIAMQAQITIVSGAVLPSAPISMINTSVTTSSYPVGTVLNLTRANIYTVSINESQSTTKWTGIVGNISAEFALQDANGYALYDWDIYTTTGEVYATKETTSGTGWAGGGIPEWTTIQCANSSDIFDE